MIENRHPVIEHDVLVIERRSQHDLVGSRAGGMTPRTLEVLDQRGIVERFLDQGSPAKMVTIRACSSMYPICPHATTTGWACCNTASSARSPTGSAK
jgi:2-polyprenyl-6-methoxyphenol hydroxylase-like FAD-dependent oxidoreductase